MKLKPINSTKVARFERLLAKVDEIFQEIEKMEKVRSDENDENIVSILKATKEVFSESIDNFKFLDLDDKLLNLAYKSFKSGIVCMRIMLKNLKNEVTSEIDDCLKKADYSIV